MPALQNLKNKKVAETILIEFQVEDGQLISAIDLLEKTGQIDAKMANGFKQTTAEINRQAQAIKADASATSPLKKNLEDINKATKNMSAEFMRGFEEGVIETLKEAGVTAEEFAAALQSGQTEVAESSGSLRQQLKNLTQQIAELKLKGEDNSEQFRQMVIEAGAIKDAIGDASSEIRNFASDTRTFDNVLGSMQALAGGFAAAQGTVALFGNENEELQKTLLKVNAAMAITQGLQSISNALEKEGALSLLATNIQLRVKNAQKVIENALESQSVIVRGAATVAQKLLNAAMAANPIGLVVVALAGLITGLAVFARSSAEARRQTASLNAELEAGAKAFEGRIEFIKQLGESSIASLENEGAVASRLANQRIENEKQIEQAVRERIERLNRLAEQTPEAEKEAREKLTDEIRRLDDELLASRLNINQLESRERKVLQEEQLKSQLASIQAQLDAAKEGSKQQLNLQKQLIAARLALELNADGLLQAEKEALIAAANKEQLELQAEFDRRAIDLQLRNIETRLVNVKEGSEQELKLRIEQLRLQVASEVTSTQLSEAEKKAIREKGFQEQLKLQREFNERIRRESIEGQISLNNAVLASVQTSYEDRLLLTISNIELQAQLEIEAAKDNANKIKEIIAQRDADILAARKAILEQQAAQEIELLIAREGANNRSLQRIADDEKRSVLDRITAIQQLAQFEIANIEKREALLKEERDKKLIGDEEYNLRYAQLQDEKAKITEDAEKKVTDVHLAEVEKRKQADREMIENVISVTQEVIGVLGQLSDLRSAQDEQRIEADRARVQELLENGAITEKEAIARQKRIDAEEKKIKREAAQRDKALAIFNAIVNTAAAVTKALPNLVLAGIAGALGAAQVAIIAARPLPRFKKGKKDKYEGPGIIGEAGAEIFEHDGKRYLAQKETLVWLGKDDKVYTPQETKMMLPQVDVKSLQTKTETVKHEGIDYDRLGKAVGKHVKIPGITVDEQGFKVWQQEGMSRTQYMNKYYSSK
jgi:hypothetical protein